MGVCNECDTTGRNSITGGMVMVDYGPIPLILFLGFIIIGMLIRVWMDPEMHEPCPAFQFPLKDAMMHEQALLWHTQNQE